MRTLKSVSMSLVIALALLALPSIGMAADGSIKATLNFDQTFEVSGIVFVPGTYVFKTIGGDKHMVQIWNGSETQLCATLLTSVDYLTTPAEKTVALFEGSEGDARKTMKSFQVKNESMAEEFVSSPATGADPKPR